MSKLADFINEYGDLGAGVLDYYELDCAREVMEDYYHGAWDSELDYAIELFDEIYLHNIPESATAYIDYEKFAYDLFMSDYFSVDVDGLTHVFSNY